MALTEDLTIFFETDEFAVVLTHSGSDYSVIFDAEYSGDEMMAGSLPMAMLPTSDASGMAIGGSVTIGGQAYTIREKQQDGTGVTNMILEEA